MTADLSVNAHRGAYAAREQMSGAIALLELAATNLRWFVPTVDIGRDISAELESLRDLRKLLDAKMRAVDSPKSSEGDTDG